MKSLVIKRSIVLHGRKSSITLEDAFWECLRKIADERKVTPSRLVSGIEAGRKTGNLSSVLRVFILEHYKDQLDRQARISKESRRAAQ
jgi:predicted DNA-binding ribbon-helix-helix protein